MNSVGSFLFPKIHEIKIHVTSAFKIFDGMDFLDVFALHQTFPLQICRAVAQILTFLATRPFVSNANKVVGSRKSGVFLLTLIVQQISCDCGMITKNW